MIRVTKPATPPAVLSGRGAEATEALKAAFDQDPAGHLDGSRELTTRAAIYGHAEVVASLRAAQHNKCCFCEQKTRGDVEHFRPKGGAQQVAADPLLKPGYYWLAYDWSNLFYACGPCNQRFKKNLFPLRDPARRARSHHDDVAAEEPLLLDPVEDDPEMAVGFRREVAHAVNGDPRGQTTIDVLQLNREELREARYDQVRLLEELRQALRAFERVAQAAVEAGHEPPADVLEQAAKIRAGLAAAVRATAAFAGAARSLLGQ